MAPLQSDNLFRLEGELDVLVAERDWHRLCSTDTLARALAVELVDAADALDIACVLFTCAATHSTSPEGVPTAATLVEAVDFAQAAVFSTVRGFDDRNAAAQQLSGSQHSAGIYANSPSSQTICCLDLWDVWHRRHPRDGAK